MNVYDFQFMSLIL